MPWIAILCGLTKEHRRKEHGMEQGERSRKGKHLTREERVVIERMYKSPAIQDWSQLRVSNPRYPCGGGVLCRSTAGRHFVARLEPAEGFEPTTW